MARGGGEATLGSKRILIVGVGAIGGHLAFEFARTGVPDLTLIDEDTLLPENTFRHVLGRKYWNIHKAKALKEEIEAQIPYIRVQAIADSIEDAVKSGVIDFNRYDLIVFAIGNPTIELAMNETLFSIGGPPAVYSWLEPLGIGGHALLTRNATGGGCFECLYTRVEDGKRVLENRAAFAAANQFFGRDLSGCASLHTPYGSMDAIRTAILAARLGIEALTGKENGNPLLSWKGGSETFVDEGYHLSPRYNASENTLFNERYSYVNPQCNICDRSK